MMINREEIASAINQFINEVESDKELAFIFLILFFAFGDFDFSHDNEKREE